MHRVFCVLVLVAAMLFAGCATIWQDLPSPAEVESEVMALLDAGKQSEAEELLGTLPPTLQRDLRLTFLSGVLERSRWSKYGAHIFFNRVIEIDPDSREAQAAKLVMDIDVGADYDRNLKSLLALAEDSADDMMITWLYAMSCREYCKQTDSTKYSQSACIAYEKLDNYWDVGPSLFHQTYANVLCELGRDSEAVVHYQKVVELEDSSWAYEGLIGTLRDLKRYDDLIEACRAALKSSPANNKFVAQWAEALQGQKKYKEAAEKYREVMAIGDAGGYHNLALFYKEGLGVSKDIEKAKELLEASAKLGNPEAFRILGTLYRDGDGVPEDRQKAEEYYLKAIDLGSEESYANLAYMYAMGRAAPKNRRIALEYYIRGAEAGDHNSALSAGLLFFQGRGTEKNYTKSLQMYLLAAELGSDSKELPGYIAEQYEHGWGTERDISKAIEWWEKGARLNNEYCVFNLGRCYEEGIGVERDIGRALQIYRNAAAAGDQRSIDKLTRMRPQYVADYKKAVEQDPAAWNYRVLIGALFALERYDECIETCKAGLEKHPKEGEIVNSWGLCLERQQKYTEAFAKYEEGAALGNPWSNHNLGLYCQKGLGVEKDLKKAKDFYEKSAAKGNAMALQSLGEMYLMGQGVTADLEMAEELFLKAGKNGYCDAYCTAGDIYAHGVYAPKNEKTALKYYQLGAKAGSWRCAWNGAVLLHEGIGMEKDHKQGLLLFLRANELNCPQEKLPEIIAKHYNQGLGVKKDLNKAKNVYEKSAKMGNRLAIDHLACIYRDGLGVVADRQKAEELFLKAAKLGYTASLCNLGYMYDAGLAGPADRQKALKYYLLGAEAGDPTCAWNAANLYASGDGPETNETKAFEMLLRAAELHYDHEDLPLVMATHYANALGTKRDISKAIEWWEKGARLNDERCWHSLGVCYENGNGVKQDMARALQFYRKAADKGYVPGINSIAMLHAASAVSEYLDGKEALKYALKLPKKSAYIDTLAAAYARNGQFKEAVKAQKEAITLLEKERGEAWKKDPALREKELTPYKERLALFESNKPYQSPPKEETL